ncbi:MAG: hypothetical protein JWQ25_952, partial [Daejeonella sp.]|nr:hypothetical protein [Daejeonella sp.]
QDTQTKQWRLRSINLNHDTVHVTLPT